jgi:hypothetical protein
MYELRKEFKKNYGTQIIMVIKINYDSSSALIITIIKIYVLFIERDLTLVFFFFVIMSIFVALRMTKTNQFI